MNANHNSPSPHELHPHRSRWEAPFRSRWSVTALSALVLILAAPAAFADDSGRSRGDRREVRVDSHSSRQNRHSDRDRDRGRYNRGDRHDNRGDRHDNRYDRHDNRGDRHDNRYDRHDNRYDRHDNRYDRHDSRYDRHDSRYDRHDNRYNRYDNRYNRYRYDWNRYDRYSNHNHSPGTWCNHRDHGHYPYFYFPRRIAYDTRYLYRDYYYDEVYYPAHGHYHTIYRFPVYVGASLTYRPYSYCDGEFFASGYFAVDGPHFSIHIGF